MVGEEGMDDWKKWREGKGNCSQDILYGRRTNFLKEGKKEETFCCFLA